MKLNYRPHSILKQKPRYDFTMGKTFTAAISFDTIRTLFTIVNSVIRRKAKRSPNATLNVEQAFSSSDQSSGIFPASWQALQTGRFLSRTAYYSLMTIMLISSFFFDSIYQAGKAPYIWYMILYLVFAHILYLRATFTLPGFIDLQRNLFRNITEDISNIYGTNEPSESIETPFHKKSFLEDNVIQEEQAKMIEANIVLVQECNTFREQFYSWNQAMSTKVNSNDDSTLVSIEQFPTYPTTPSLTALLFMLHKENNSYYNYITSTSHPVPNAPENVEGPLLNDFHMFLLRVITEHPSFCAKCRIVKAPLARHCHTCGHCVARFDHHCPFLGNCVGARNHFRFILFMFSHLPLMFYGFDLNISSFPGFDLYDYHMYFRVGMCLLFFFCSLVIVLLGGFQLYLMFSNTTTLSTITQFRKRNGQGGLTKPGESILKKYADAASKLEEEKALQIERQKTLGLLADIDLDDVNSTLDLLGEMISAGCDEPNVKGYTPLAVDEALPSPMVTSTKTFNTTWSDYFRSLSDFIDGFTTNVRIFTPLARIHYPPVSLHGLDDFQTRQISTEEEALWFQKPYFKVLNEIKLRLNSKKQF